MADKAQKDKDKGNAAFKAGDYPAAIGHYTAAILADRVDATYPLNRAAAYLKLDMRMPRGIVVQPSISMPGM